MLREHTEDLDSKISMRDNETAMKPLNEEQPNSSMLNKSAGFVR